MNKLTTELEINLPYSFETYNELLTEFQLLHLLYHRSLNQHHVSNWWKDLNLLHRHLRNLLLICSDIDEIIKTKKLTIIKFNKFRKKFLKVKEIPFQSYKKRINRNRKNNKTFKKNIHLLSIDESKNLIDSKLDSFYKISKYLLKCILPACYWSFMGIIELSQFISIGFALVAISSKVFSLLKNIDSLNFNKLIAINNTKEEVKKVHSIINNEIGYDEDLGEHLIETTESNVKIKENLSRGLENLHEISIAGDNIDEELGADYAPKDELDDKSCLNTNSRKNSIFSPENDDGKRKTKKKVKKNKTKNAKNTINDIFGI